jgi:hypothetical protein
MIGVKRVNNEVFKFTIGLNNNKIIIRRPVNFNSKNALIMENRLKIKHKDNIQFIVYKEAEKLRDV